MNQPHRFEKAVGLSVLCLTDAGLAVARQCPTEGSGPSLRAAEHWRHGAITVGFLSRDVKLSASDGLR
jgi:hypothetical protein